MFDSKQEKSEVNGLARAEDPAMQTASWSPADTPVMRAARKTFAAGHGLPTTGDDAMSGLIAQTHDLEARIDTLVEEVAARDVTIAELSNDTRELRDECQRRAGEISEIREKNQPLEEMLADSQARVELLETRLREALAVPSQPKAHDSSAHLRRNTELQQQLDSLLIKHTDLVENNRLLRTELEQAVDTQQQLLTRQANRDSIAAQVPPPPPPHDSVPKEMFESEMACARTLIDGLETAVQQKEKKLVTLQGEVQALRNFLRHVDPRAIQIAQNRLKR